MSHGITFVACDILVHASDEVMAEGITRIFVQVEAHRKRNSKVYTRRISLNLSVVFSSF